MKFSIVLSTNPTAFDAVVFEGDFARNAAQIAEIGYEGVELAVRDPALIDSRAIGRTLAQLGLKVPAIGTGQAFGEDGLSFTDRDESIRRAARARIAEHIRLAARFEAIVILGLIRGVAAPEVGRATAMAWLVEALRECAELASQHDVRLVVEPIRRQETNLVNTIGEGLSLLAQVGASHEVLGLLPDTYHMFVEEDSLAASLRQAGPHIFHCHVADSNRRYPGAGDLDFKRILSLLADELGYRGWVSAETLARPDARTAAARGLAHLRACAPGEPAR
jgi:5-keto-L-gluconate epimerase